MPISEAELDAAMELALQAAHVASSIINRAVEEKSTTALDIQTKSNTTDLVTKYDKQCEDEVLAILRAGTPDYAILSEESNSKTELDAKPTWVVDPIDGTTSFVHGLFDCSVSIALAVDREPILGVVSVPRLQEVYCAVKGRGAFCNGKRIHVSPVTELQQSVISFHQSYNRSAEAVTSTVAAQTELAKIPLQSIRCHGAASLDMCYVAAGRMEAYVEVGIYAWDYAAGTIIVREAGGVVHDVEDVNTFDLMRRGMCCGCNTTITHKVTEIANKHNYRNSILNSGS